MGGAEMQSSKKIYIGIDVHKKTYSITAATKGEIIKQACMPADPVKLVKTLRKWFGLNAHIYTAYEAGFSGFFLHRHLEQNGIKNIVVNPASIEIAINDRVKTDQRDSKKIAEQLYMGRLKSIYIPGVAEEKRRQVTRTRDQLIKDRTRFANRIKARLYYFGSSSCYFNQKVSESYLQDLEQQDFYKDLCLEPLVNQWRKINQEINLLKVPLQEQVFEDPEIYEIYKSVPGIGNIHASILSNELGDLSKRFKNERALFKYTGLTPMEFSSGENIRRGSIDRQGSARIRKILVEAAWIAVTNDMTLKRRFQKLSYRRGSKRAIVAIARSLAGRIRACFIKRELYVM